MITNKDDDSPIRKKKEKKKMIMMTIQREGQRFSEVVPEFEESGITEQKR